MRVITVGHSTDSRAIVEGTIPTPDPCPQWEHASVLFGWMGGVLPQTDFFSGWASRESMCRLRAHLNELEKAKQLFLLEQRVLGHFPQLQSCFPIIFPFLGSRASPLFTEFISFAIS